MKIVKITTILCAVAILALPSVAKPSPVDTMDIAHTGYAASSIIQIWAGGLEGEAGFGGIFMLEKTDGTGQGNTWPNGPLGGLCIELSEEPSSSTLTYEVVMPEYAHKPTTFLGGPIGIDKAEYLRELWGRFFDPEWVTSETFTAQQNSDATAFNAAVWEIIYEDLPLLPAMWDVTVDGTDGLLGFRCDNVDTATANNWLHTLDGNGPKTNLRALVYDGQQDFLVEIPEPLSIFLLGAGALLVRSKKSKNKYA